MALVAVCVASVALGNIDLHFVWQACYLATSGAAHGDIDVHFCMAGVALGDINLQFVWQAWHLATSTFAFCGRRGAYGTGLVVARLVPVGRCCRRGCLCCRHGTWRHRPSLCVAGVVLLLALALVARLDC